MVYSVSTGRVKRFRLELTGKSRWDSIDLLAGLNVTSDLNIGIHKYNRVQ